MGRLQATQLQSQCITQQMFQAEGHCDIVIPEVLRAVYASYLDGTDMSIVDPPDAPKRYATPEAATRGRVSYSSLASVFRCLKISLILPQLLYKEPGRRLAAAAIWPPSSRVSRRR